MQNLIKYNLFTTLTKFLVIILPFYVVLKVFFEIKLGIPKFGFLIKELVIVLLFGSLLYEYIKSKRFPKFQCLDYLIFLYIGYGIIITLINGLGLSHILYGGRYDFLFFIVFLLYRHSAPFLKIRVQQLLQLFLLSASISLFLSIFIKFVIGEEILTLIGFHSYTSDWTFTGSIPNYHGLENSGVRRFQGILDSPNAMGFFLIIFASLFAHTQKIKKDLGFVLISIFLFSLIIITYSRSALLGVGSGLGLLFLFNIKHIYKNYRKVFLSSVIVGVFIFSAIGYVFQEKIYNVIVRPSSTSGHFERMEIGFERFLEKPFGSGLATSGPAFRNVYPEKQTKADEVYYIPESWFIQQLTEGGIVYFSLFLLIFLGMLGGLYKKSQPVFAGLVAILVMNVFLHVFEATYLSYIFFLFIGLILQKK